MDWKRARETERTALKRLVALLLALADLASGACSRSQPVRRLLVWVLSRAAAVAQDLFDEPPHAPPLLHSAGDGRAEARKLAMQFRAMARKLDREAALAFAVHGAEHEQTEHRLHGQQVKRRIGSPLDILHAVVAAVSARHPAPPRPP